MGLLLVFLQAHRAEICRELATCARDLMTIAKAPVEADADSGAASADLQERMLRALPGYLRYVPKRGTSPPDYNPEGHGQS